jgi:ELWxxDGT repeat protein
MIVVPVPSCCVPEVGLPGIVLSVNTGAPADLVALGNTLIFGAYNNTTSTSALWVRTGIQADPAAIHEVQPGAQSSISAGYPSYRFHDAGSQLYFVGYDAAAGSELWRSDGSAAGTFRVKDINTGDASSSPSEFTTVGNMLFFVADDGSNGRELWKSDGTETGTVLVQNIKPGSLGSNPHSLTGIGDTLYFVVDDGATGQELWQSDGTASGTRRVTDLGTGNASGVFSIL